MSSPTAMRRQDRALPSEEAWGLLESGFCGRLATIGADGFPYVTPLLYVTHEGRILVHRSAAPGHMPSNIGFCDRVCFEVDQPGKVFAYGGFECDTSLAYASVIAFGRIEIIDDLEAKRTFSSLLMAKYGGEIQGRDKDVFPRIDHIAVYAITVQRLTGKHIALPPPSQQWPATDRTKTPNASPAGRKIEPRTG